MKNALVSVQWGRGICVGAYDCLFWPHKKLMIYGLAELTDSQGLCPSVFYTLAYNIITIIQDILLRNTILNGQTLGAITHNTFRPFNNTDFKTN